MLTYLLLLLPILYLLWRLATPKVVDGIPPGPTPFPFIGNIPQLAMTDLKAPHVGLGKLAEKYGELMSFWFGVHYMVVISSYEMMKEILTKHEATIQRFIFPFVPDRAYGHPQKGIIWNYGESWIELKRHTIRTLKDFGVGKRNFMNGIIQDVVAECIDEMKKSCSSENIWNLDIHLLSSLSINILWGQVAGFRWAMSDKKLKAAVKLNDTIIVSVGPTNMYSAFPWVKKLMPKFSGFEQHMRSYQEMQEFLDGVVNDIRENRKKRGNSEPESYIEVYLDEINKTEGKDPNFTEQQLNVILQDLFLAGSETTSNTLSWFILYMATHPKEQEKLYEEISHIIGVDNVPSLEFEGKMPYMKAAIYETFRMADGITPMAAPRVAAETFTVNGFTIPKGAGLMINMQAACKNKKVWGDPDNFRPDRFIITKDDGSIGLVNLERAYPFGFGKRLCLGENLAQNTIFLFLTTLFQKFQFSVPDGAKPPRMDQLVAATLSPHPYAVKMKGRR